MKHIDELLNKYIDNDLSTDELKELTRLLEEDDQARDRLRALKAVESAVRKAPVHDAPANFTARFMQRLKPVKIKASSNKFVYWITGVFIFLTLVSGYVFREALNAESSEGSFEMPDLFAWLPEVNLSGALAFLQSDVLMLIGSALTIILMISAFLFIEGHKNFRDRFNNSAR